MKRPVPYYLIAVLAAYYGAMMLYALFTTAPLFAKLVAVPCAAVAIAAAVAVWRASPHAVRALVAWCVINLLATAATYTYTTPYIGAAGRIFIRSMLVWSVMIALMALYVRKRQWHPITPKS